VDILIPSYTKRQAVPMRTRQWWVRNDEQMRVNFGERQLPWDIAITIKGKSYWND